MSKDNYKNVRNLKIDYAPKWKKPHDWRGLAYAVSVLAFIAAISIIIAFDISWSNF